MRRLLVTLLLAHVVASYSLAVALTIHVGPPHPAAWLFVTVRSPLLLWTITTRGLRVGMPWTLFAAAYAGYGLGFAGTVAARALEGRRSRKTRRRRQGLCTECGYDLTGNVSGKCPECGVHVNPKARLLVRRNA
jgi:hypothetical protein